MKFSINRVFGLAVLVGLAGAGLSRATTLAKFHLPVTAHWGQATLLPGDYEIGTAETPSGIKQFEITRGKQHVRAWAITTDVNNREGGSSLQLVERNGSFFVREYRSSDAGKTFVFSIPKSSALGETKVVEIRN